MSLRDPQFKTKTGFAFPGVTLAERAQLWSELAEKAFITPAQMVEAASYSMAMVVRHALGLSASGGRVLALVGDCPAGWIAMATIRHLINAGGEGLVLQAGSTSAASPEFELQARSLRALGIEFGDLSLLVDGTQSHLLPACHNVLIGLLDAPHCDPAVADKCISLLNEARTPIHSVEAPLGFNLDTGQGGSNPLFSSSTLSLGAPLQGLFKGSDFVGRHYLCDISIMKQSYAGIGIDLGHLFAEQPVVEIFPIMEEETE
ncbi:MAG: hypothetical protein DCC75_04705 [Proteobacteria bacterium]|nr:MAG: hypothetical protein DCC75_04705 [Pseudomonadota bacterium]